MEKEIIEIEIGKNVDIKDNFNISIESFKAILDERHALGATHFDLYNEPNNKGFNMDFFKIRKETDKEFRLRQNREAAAKEKIEKLRLDRERAEYEKLKKKFENNQ